MIELKQNYDGYDYDIRTLLQAFFPGEAISDRKPGDRVFTAEFNEDGRVKLTFRDSTAEESECISGAFHDRVMFRNPFKRAVYRILSRVTGRTLPWGTLTGIRPARLMTAMISSGLKKDQAVNQFRREYLARPEKAELAYDVAFTERSMISAWRESIIPGKNVIPFSIYAGIPFCPSRCLYCSFPSNSMETCSDMVEPYLDSLEQEIESVSSFMKKCQQETGSIFSLSTIYVGGGTPTALTAPQLDRLLSVLERNFKKPSEITVEAGRPDTITLEKLETLRKHGVRRISVNPQTMNQKTLDIMGRRHSVGQVIRAYEMARQSGMDNVNMDLILGLPGEGPDEIRRTFDMIEELMPVPESLTVHTLALKRTARLNEQMDRYRASLCPVTEEMVRFGYDRALNMGMKPYYMYRQKNMSGAMENIGYCRPGYECLYNILIMEEMETIIGFGAGASSKFLMSQGDQHNMVRGENVKDLRSYIQRTEEMCQRKRKMIAELAGYKDRG